MKIISYIFILLIIILGVSFAILNGELITIHYYVGTKQIPLSLVMALTFSFGLMLGLLITTFTILRLKTEKYRLKKRLKTADQEIENLRAIPIKDER